MLEDKLIRLSLSFITFLRTSGQMLGPAGKFPLLAHVNIRVLCTTVYCSVRAFFLPGRGHCFVLSSQGAVPTPLLYRTHFALLYARLGFLCSYFNLPACLVYGLMIFRPQDVVIFLHPYQHQTNKIRQPGKKGAAVVCTSRATLPLRHQMFAEHERVNACRCQELVDHARLPSCRFPHLMEAHHPLPKPVMLVDPPH